MNHLLTPAEVAPLLNKDRVTEGMVRSLIRSGRLGSTRIGRQVFVPLEAVEEFLHSDRAPVPTAPELTSVEAAGMSPLTTRRTATGKRAKSRAPAA